MESGSHEARRGAIPNLAVGRMLRRGCRRSHGMAIQQRRQQAAIHKPRDGDVVRRRCESCDDLLAFHKALELMSVGIMPATTEAVSEVVGIEILDCERV